MVFHTLEIQDKIRETSQAVSLVFRVPKDLQKAYEFAAGQYVTLEKDIEGQKVRRAYSISSTQNTATLQITIKAIEKGLFSNYACSKLQVGDSIKVSTPEGNFTHTAIQKQKHVLFIAAGSGITPIFSIVKSALQAGTKNSLTLVYGNKSIRQTLFKKQLDLLCSEYKAIFSVFYVFSQENNKEAMFGRIDKGILNYVQKQTQKTFDMAFLCGPEALINSSKAHLLQQGMPAEQIYSELFFSSASEPVASPHNDTTTITVLVDDQEATFTMSQKQTILAASLAQDIEVPYSCQGGVCSSCMAKVTQGKAMMTKNSILTDDEIAEGLVLTCMAHPTSENIKIDFDDI